jgi:hypothetical protein
VVSDEPYGSLFGTVWIEGTVHRISHTLLTTSMGPHPFVVTVCGRCVPQSLFFKYEVVNCITCAVAPRPDGTEWA